MTKDNQGGRVIEARPVTAEDLRPPPRLRGWRASNRALQRRQQPQITMPPLKWLEKDDA
jgi:hypothetical protein